MQSYIEKAKVKAFYWAKVVELGNESEAAKLIQWRKDHNVSGDWESLSCGAVIEFRDGYDFRIKPETVQHRGGGYPKPCTVDEAVKAPSVFSPFYNEIGLIAHEWNDPRQKANIARGGLAYLKEEDAIARGKVIFEVD